MNRPLFAVLLACFVLACGSTETPPSSPGTTSDDATCTAAASTPSTEPKEATDGTCSDLAPPATSSDSRKIVQTFETSGQPPEPAGGEIPSGRYHLTRSSVWNWTNGEESMGLAKSVLFVTGSTLFQAATDPDSGCLAGRRTYSYRVSGSTLEVNRTCSTFGLQLDVWTPEPTYGPMAQASWEYTSKGDELTLIRRVGTSGERTEVDVWTRQAASPPGP